MARLLIVHHTPSPAMHSMFTSVREGATDPQIIGVEVVTRPALTATAVDVLKADAVVVGSPVNLGYISGALKHFFDTIYYPCLEETRGKPFAGYLHGNDDATGALRALDIITTGLQWKHVRPMLVLTGAPSGADLEACWELGATVSAGIAA